jgi:hypothetical protein
VGRGGRGRSDARAALAAIEQRVVAMANGHLERALTDALLSRGAPGTRRNEVSLSQRFEQVLERVAEAGVGFDALSSS